MTSILIFDTKGNNNWHSKWNGYKTYIFYINSIEYKNHMKYAREYFPYKMGDLEATIKSKFCIEGVP